MRTQKADQHHCSSAFCFGYLKKKYTKINTYQLKLKTTNHILTILTNIDISHIRCKGTSTKCEENTHIVQKNIISCKQTFS